jgi:hypothetical protein
MNYMSSNAIRSKSKFIKCWQIYKFHYYNNNNNNKYIIKREIESKIVAAQDQAISTNYFKNNILKEEIDSKCRLCNNLKKLLTT